MTDKARKNLFLYSLKDDEAEKLRSVWSDEAIGSLDRLLREIDDLKCANVGFCKSRKDLSLREKCLECRLIYWRKKMRDTKCKEDNSKTSED